MIWSRVELRHGSFVAIATAIACNTREVGSPEERTLECDMRDPAEALAARRREGKFPWTTPSSFP